MIASIKSECVSDRLQTQTYGWVELENRKQILEPFWDTFSSLHVKYDQAKFWAAAFTKQSAFIIQVRYKSEQPFVSPAVNKQLNH